ncbi:hypothetical protein CIB48_g2915 [Xylaria polymorpha]|nr:hypothetical protein CIB48_g2915 [Xylaria polymorpha]
MASIPTRRILLATRPCLRAAAAARISHSSPYIPRARFSIAAPRAGSSPQKPSTPPGTSGARQLSSSAAPESKIWQFEEVSPSSPPLPSQTEALRPSAAPSGCS